MDHGYGQKSNQIYHMLSLVTDDIPEALKIDYKKVFLGDGSSSGVSHGEALVRWRIAFSPYLCWSAADARSSSMMRAGGGSTSWFLRQYHDLASLAKMGGESWPVSGLLLRRPGDRRKEARAASKRAFWRLGIVFCNFFLV